MKSYNIEEIYDKHLDTIYRFFYYRTFSVHVSEDLTSQTFLIFVEKAKQAGLKLTKPEKFLYGIMRKVWLRHLQQKYRQKEELVENIDDFQAFVKVEVEQESSLPDQKRVEKFVNMLPPSQKQVMRLRLVEQNTLSEICEILKKDMNYVKTTQKRAIRKLKELISDAPLNLGKEA